MGAAREKDQADFDLEAFIDLFDEALTSNDPSVQKTLQHLMVIAALARNHGGHDRRSGPLRRLFDDQNNIIRRLERLETGSVQFPGGGFNPSAPYGPGIGQWPYMPSPATPLPGTGTGSWPGPGPNQIWCGTSTSATSLTVPDLGAYSSSATLDPLYGAIPTLTEVVPKTATKVIAERVDDLLKSDYKGSTVGKI